MLPLKAFSKTLTLREAERIADDISRPSPLMALLMAHPTPPLTRWERMKKRARDCRERVTGAWAVLRGQAAADYGDY